MGAQGQLWFMRVPSGSGPTGLLLELGSVSWTPPSVTPSSLLCAPSRWLGPVQGKGQMTGGPPGSVAGSAEAWLPTCSLPGGSFPASLPPARVPAHLELCLPGPPLCAPCHWAQDLLGPGCAALCLTGCFSRCLAHLPPACLLPSPSPGTRKPSPLRAAQVSSGSLVPRDKPELARHLPRSSSDASSPGRGPSGS